MTWNYRVIENDLAEEPIYHVHEVYYDEDDNIEAYVAEPAVAMGQGDQGIMELMANYGNMIEAVGKPFLKLSDLKENVG